MQFKDGNVQLVQATTSVPSTPLGLTEPTIAKLAEYGGFISCVLALSLFFWVLTQFVKQVKED